jgi:S-adenosylmethionine:tRNA-ribosyltransferase-isomerase (queuine synthetase)
VHEGDRIDFGHAVSAVASEREADGSLLLTFDGTDPVEVLLARAGHMPLPPYIASRRPPDERDNADYQTMFAREDGTIAPFEGDTAIFITPGYRFRGIDGLMTNFHLPRSTLFMLVSALMGLERMQAAYAHAIATGYRFYSYGDSSLLLPGA